MTNQQSFGVMVAMKVAVCIPDAIEGDSPDSIHETLRALGVEPVTIVASRTFPETQPDLLVVDAGERLDFAQEVKSKLDECWPRTPTLLVLHHTRLTGFEPSWGYDDFLLTPLVPMELLGRLRQLDWKHASFSNRDLIKYGMLLIDSSSRQVSLGGKQVSMTQLEFDLLYFLASRPNRALSRDQLLDNVWGGSYAGGDRTIDIHVRRLRAKLGKFASSIQTVRGVGYKFTKPLGG